MRAVIVGAGIAGLVAARQLGFSGWDVEVLERSPGPRPDGYMMDFFGPGMEAAKRIGLYPRLTAVAYRVEALEYINAAGHVTSRLKYSNFSRLACGNVLSLLRPDMERAALSALDDVPGGRVRIRYGERAGRGWNDDGGHAAVVSSAGAVLRADVLIGADGLHSDVRGSVFGPEDTYLRPLGMCAAAFITADARLSAYCRDRFVLTDSIDRTAGLYGLRDGEVAAFLVYRDSALSPDSLPGVKEPATGSVRDRLRREFGGLGPAVDRLLELCPEHPYDDAVAQVVLPSWQKGHVTLVGDACGAVSLLAGQGGSLAIAGAALLAEALGPVRSARDVEPALAAYEQRLRPVVEAAQAAGRRTAATFLPANPAQRFLRKWAIRATSVPGIDRLVARRLLRATAK